MKFIEGPPPDQSAISLPLGERPPKTFAMLDVPELSMFVGEVKFWRDTNNTAQRNHEEALQAGGPEAPQARGHEALQTIASNMQKELLQVSRNGAKLRLPGVRPELNSGEIANWYSRSTAFLAWSRMWRQLTSNVLSSIGDELEGANDEAKLASLLGGLVQGDEKPIIITDLDASTAESCRLHLTPDWFQAWFEVEPPARKEIVWLEGSSVYVKTCTPAEYSPELERTILAGDISLPCTGLVTARPYLKAKLWPSYYPPEQ